MRRECRGKEEGKGRGKGGEREGKGRGKGGGKVGGGGGGGGYYVYLVRVKMHDGCFPLTISHSSII